MELNILSIDIYYDSIFFLTSTFLFFFLRKKTSNKYKYDDHFTSISACGGVRAEIQVARRKEHPPSKQHKLEI